MHVYVCVLTGISERSRGSNVVNLKTLEVGGRRSFFLILSDCQAG